MSSHPIWLRDVVRVCLSSCAAVGADQQRVRDPAGRLQVHHADEEATRSTSQRHWNLVKFMLVNVKYNKYDLNVRIACYPWPMDKSYHKLIKIIYINNLITSNLLHIKLN